MANETTRTILLPLARRLGLLGWLYSTVALMVIGNPALLARAVTDQFVPAGSQRSPARPESDDDDDGDAETVKLHKAAGLPRRSERRTTLLTPLSRLCRPAPVHLSGTFLSSQPRPAPFHGGSVPPLRC
jgi:hypothetical protein